MTAYALLVSPRAKSAYFSAYLKVAVEELSGLPGIGAADLVERGGMDFLHIEATEADLPALARLSFVQGIFRREPGGLVPVDLPAVFTLHEDFVFGAKYRGKTNETLTQLLINIGLQHVAGPAALTPNLIDPMCGRGTSLAWALRYGVPSTGIEQDKAALPDLQRNLKKWSKLHRVKHSLTTETQKESRRRHGPVGLKFEAEATPLHFLLGDTEDTLSLIGKQRFSLLVADLPYGVQHVGRDGMRNPLDTVAAAAPGWTEALKPGGAMVLAYNRYLPKRHQLEAIFTALGFQPVMRDLEHRMSEAIVRDVLILTKPL